MATVNKDFRVKHGLIVEGTTGTINGNNILTTANDTGDLAEGTNLYFTDARAKTSAADLLTNATLTNIQITGDGNGLTITAENGVADSTTDDLAEGLTNLYFTNARAVSAIEAATLTTLTVDDIILDGATINVSELSINGDAGTITGAGSINLVTGDAQFNGETIATQAYADQAEADAISTASADATSKANTAESNANSYTDGRETAITAAYEAYADQAEADAISTASADATSKANTAESNANDYTDSLIGDATVDGTGGNTITDRIATAVANLVDSAPETLDTLNELAAALNDDPNFVTTVTTSIGEKVAKSGDTMTGFLTLSADPTNALHAATKQYVDAEVPDNTDDVPEGSENLYFTNARAIAAVDGTDRAFTSVEVNSVALQVAATATLGGTSETTVYSFDASVYRSAKFLVKAAYGTHTEVSEVLLTLDSSDNIAITEYAVVSTNGSLIDITAAPSGIGDNMDLLVTAGTANTTVTVFGTLIA